MSYFYSDTTKAFYPESLMDTYKSAGSWPEDVISITEDQYNKMHDALSEGKKMIKVGHKGRIKVVPLPLSEIKQLDAGSERHWRNEELSRADIELLKAEDGDGVGTPQEWRKYRVSLRAWPSHASFPNSEFRPVAPDFKTED